MLRTPAGDLLGPIPHPLAITRPDGRRMTTAEVVECALERRPPIGHHPHRPGLLPPYGCTPAKPEQLALELDL